MLPSIKVDAQSLQREWPSVPGRLPFSGEYFADDSEPTSLFVFDVYKPIEVYRWTEHVEPFISKGPQGQLRFDVGTVATKVEHHSNGSMPATFTMTTERGRVEMEVQRFELLEPQWFLVWYEVHDL